MKYYIAGKMTGKPNFGYDDFAKAADNLRGMGLDIASPHEIDYDEMSYPRGSLPYKTYLACGLQLLAQCDAIILLPDWHQSTGAKLELEFAKAAKLALFDYREDPLWIITHRWSVVESTLGSIRNSIVYTQNPETRFIPVPIIPPYRS